MRMSRRMGLLKSGLSNLTGTSWLFNDLVTIPQSLLAKTFAINFYSGSAGSEYYTSLGFDYSSVVYLFTYGSMDYVYYVYKTSDTHQWQADAYKAIQITGGVDATNTDLIEWLTSNATRTA